MTPARANILTLLQCRSLWVWHIWGLLVCPRIPGSPAPRGPRSMPGPRPGAADGSCAIRATAPLSIIAIASPSVLLFAMFLAPFR